MDLNISKFSHFSFDLWLTIIRSNPEFKGKRDRLLKEFFSLDQDLDEIRKEVRYYDLLFNRISEKTGFHIQREVAFLLILKTLGKNEEEITTESLSTFFTEVDRLFLEYRPVLLWENIEEILIKIKDAGKTANVLSNTAFIHGQSLVKVLDDLGLSTYFSFMIFSDIEKVSKPNPKIFETVCRKVNEFQTVNKSEILHIGDNIIADFEGAKNFGFEAKLIKF
ncbi:HAD family hydrolase [Kaistella sp.]|uniref:HAD family hydrolase n=1 Tax=Kaistella sp. TaxID=2782235 RepID=UPI0035A155E6